MRPDGRSTIRLGDQRKQNYVPMLDSYRTWAAHACHDQALCPPRRRARASDYYETVLLVRGRWSVSLQAPMATTMFQLTQNLPSIDPLADIRFAFA